MQIALAGKPVFYAIQNWNRNQDSIWGPQMGNSWGTVDPLDSSFFSIRKRFYENLQNGGGDRAGPGGWADLGNLWIGINPSLTVSQMQTHFALWSFSKAPLFISV